MNMLRGIITGCLSFCILYVCGQSDDGYPDRLYAREQAWAFPAGGAVVLNRAPAFTWPVREGSGIRYTVALSTDSLFQAGNTIRTGFFPWAVYVPHDGLESGVWYWKTGVRNGTRTDVEWSPVYRFTVAAEAIDNTSPAPEDLLSRTNTPHPRLWIRPENMEGFQKRNEQNPEARRTLEAAEKLVGIPLPDETPTRVRDTSGMSDLDKKLTIEFMYHGFGTRVSTPVEQLCAAYMLTGSEKFAREGIRRALQLASFDPQGLATRDDFNSGNIMEAMALAYDRFYDLLTASQKESLRKAISVRAGAFYEHMVNHFEAHLCDNHVWQHILRNFTITAFATVHDIPEASVWLTYVYEVWSGRFPVLGTSDGGWHEGNGYFPVHFKTLIYLPVLFRQFTGINYFDIPWFANLPQYMMYSFPAGSPSVSLGDKQEDLLRPAKTWTAFTFSLAREIQDPALARYTADLEKENPGYISGDANFLLHRLLTYDPAGNIPSRVGSKPARAKLFKDIGLAVSHSFPDQADKNLMVSLSSSPFGALGHAHASQNSLTVNYKGKKIIGGSGFYTNFSDHHNLLHYRTSRAYSTILADSIGQSISEYGYGYMEQFATGKRLSYFAGDASNAYTGTLSAFWKDRFNRRAIQMTRENGVGNAGVKKFKRQVLTIDSSYVIVYDDLEAVRPVRWTWQTHSPLPIRKTDKDVPGTWFRIDIDNGDISTIAVFASTPVAETVHHHFNYPAKNWKGKEDKDGNIAQYPDEWHAGATSAATHTFRFLTILFLGKADSPQSHIRQLNETSWQLGEFSLTVEMNADNHPYLGIKDEKSTVLFTSDADNPLFGKRPSDGVSSDKIFIFEKETGQSKVYVPADARPAGLMY